jgi:alginate O-acetyltransferase complex protein AlgI
VSFVSLSVVGVQLAALILRAVTRRSRASYLVGLLTLSWLFYAWSVPEYLILILVSTTVDYCVGRLLAATPESARVARRGLLGISLTLNLGVLAYFKYAGFIARNWMSLAGGLGLWTPDVTTADIVLPIGISFYTFESISYTIDVYRGRIEAEKNFLRLACFIAFFPHLVAGPIVRAHEFLYQLERPRRIRIRVFAEGTYLVIRGLFLKMVVADNLGQLVDQHWRTAGAEAPAGALAMTLLVFFACQLFCDFAGYSDIARGLAYQLGFRLPINFNAPYVAATFTEFWRRWHITLSSWMRDYVYIPLGGNRRGPGRGALNLLLVMLVAGLWHGANWTFVAWGVIHGFAVALERALGLARGPHGRMVSAAWYVVVQMTWILSLGMFRAEDVRQGYQVIHNAMAGLAMLPSSLPPSPSVIAIGWWFVLPVVALHARSLLTERRWLPAVSELEKAAYAGTMVAAILTLYATSREFIYFKF